MDLEASRACIPGAMKLQLVSPRMELRPFSGASIFTTAARDTSRHLTLVAIVLGSYNPWDCKPCKKGSSIPTTLGHSKFSLSVKEAYYHNYTLRLGFQLKRHLRLNVIHSRDHGGWVLCSHSPSAVLQTPVSPVGKRYISGALVSTAAAQGILHDQLALITRGDVFLSPRGLWKIKRCFLAGYHHQGTAQTAQ